MTQEKTAAFLAELSALSSKHGIAIHGCGCCGSPYLIDVDFIGNYRVESLTDPDHLSFVKADSHENTEPGAP